MLPVYLSYFTGGDERDTKKSLLCASGFILGFSAVFIGLGAVSGLLGGLLRRHQVAVNIVTGMIVVLFGLSYIGLFEIPFLSRAGAGRAGNVSGFFSAVIFGIVFSISWTPCVGAFLGSAMMLASQQGSAVRGILMLSCFSAGLGLPFLLSAILIDSLKSAFDWIKKHYETINIVSGLFLVVMGVMMMTGMMNRLFSLMS